MKKSITKEIHTENGEGVPHTNVIKVGRERKKYTMHQMKEIRSSVVLKDINPPHHTFDQKKNKKQLKIMSMDLKVGM